jgi:carboxyl-terminal PDZ ligand of neuronal nitric oxide synthase protein
MKEKLEQQSMSTQSALAQINLLRDQLNAETAARVEAQVEYLRILSYFNTSTLN